MGVSELRQLSFDDLVACNLTAQDAGTVLESINTILENTDGLDLPQIWRLISKHVLQPDLPFDLHVGLYRKTYHGWDESRLGPPPTWIPESCAVTRTNIARFMDAWQGNALWQSLRSGDAAADWPLLQRLSFEDPESFWPAVLRQLGIRFHHPPSRILARHEDPDRAVWLPDARFNIAECALTGRDPDRRAVVWAEEGAPSVIRSMTLGTLASRAWHVCAALRASGYAPGTAIAVDMVLTVDAVCIYLGIVLAGCVVVSIADSFSAAEIASRLHIAEAAAIFTQDYVRRGEKRIPLHARVAEAGAPTAIVLPARSGDAVLAKLRPGDVTWRAFLARARAPGGRHVLRPGRAHGAAPSAPTNVLFSSGTTGEPKAIPFTHITPLRAAANAFFHQDVRGGDVVAWPTSLGWMMGPWLLYGALLNDATIALFHGPPTGRAFGEFVSAARVTMLGTVPSMVRAWRGSGCMRGLDWSAVRAFSSTGEASAPDDCLWLSARAGYKPVIEYCGGTELGGAVISNTQVEPQAPSTFTGPTIGCQVVLLPQEGAAEGEPSQHGAGGESRAGELAIATPSIGQSQTLLNRDHAKIYLEGMPRGPGDRYLLRRHGDMFERLPGGAYRALGRADDTMNLGGIKTSSAELERAIAAGVPGVVEAAAVACPTPGGGPDLLHVFVVLGPGAAGDGPPGGDLRRAVQHAISTRLNPLFKVHRVLVRASLPRNASNKVTRRVLRDELLASHSKL